MNLKHTSLAAMFVASAATFTSHAQKHLAPENALENNQTPYFEASHYTCFEDRVLKKDLETFAKDEKTPVLVVYQLEDGRYAFANPTTIFNQSNQAEQYTAEVMNFAKKYHQKTDIHANGKGIKINAFNSQQVKAKGLDTAKGRDKELQNWQNQKNAAFSAQNRDIVNVISTMGASSSVDLKSVLNLGIK